MSAKSEQLTRDMITSHLEIIWSRKGNERKEKKERMKKKYVKMKSKTQFSNESLFAMCENAIHANVNNTTISIFILFFQCDNKC